MKSSADSLKFKIVPQNIFLFLAHSLCRTHWHFYSASFAVIIGNMEVDWFSLPFCLKLHWWHSGSKTALRQSCNVKTKQVGRPTIWYYHPDILGLKEFRHTGLSVLKSGWFTLHTRKYLKILTNLERAEETRACGVQQRRKSAQSLDLAFWQSWGIFTHHLLGTLS